MPGINVWAIIAAAIAAFVASAIWYAIFAGERAKLSLAASTGGRPNPVQMLIELARNLILVVTLAYFVRRLAVSTLGDAIVLALIFWVGFPLILLTGSVIYEKVPWKLAAIHAGDWLLKLLIMTCILAVWT